MCHHHRIMSTVRSVNQKWHRTNHQEKWDLLSKIHLYYSQLVVEKKSGLFVFSGSKDCGFQQEQIDGGRNKSV